MAAATRARVVFVDDEPDLAEAMGAYFTDLGHDVTCVRDGVELEALLRAGPVDLVILDLGLPGRGGFDLMQDMPALADCGVIILSGRADPLERVLGLELGADDFVAKPVDPRELAARAAAVLARRRGHARRLVAFESVTADLGAARLLTGSGTTEPLGPGEVALIAAFAAHPQRILSREMLLDLAPADDAEAQDRAIDARVARLRRRLQTAWIETVRGYGYRFAPPG